MALPSPEEAAALNVGLRTGPVTDARLRVLVLSDVFPPRQGGSGRWLWELYRRLPMLETTVLAGPAPSAIEFDRISPLRIERLTAPFASWGLMSPAGAAGYFRAVRQVRRTMRDARPAAMHCGKCLPEALVALAARGRARTPVWCFAHGEELTLARTSRELRALTRTVLRRVSGVVANSRHTRRLLLEDWGVDARKIIVLTPGVDTRRFGPAPVDSDARERLGWTGRRVILTVGALQKRKGQDMVIRALPAIRQTCPDVLYAVAGEGWEREYLAGLSRDLGVHDIVSFLGVPDEAELVRYYQQCDLFVLANRQVGWDFEGFGIVLLEAQACGRPVIAGASGGTAETMIPGETGVMVSGEDADELAEACLSFLQSPGRCAEFGRRGRTWVEQRFDWSVLADEAGTLFSPVYP